MADNVPITPGSGGAVIATDDIGGFHFQRVKLIHGPDGVNAGDVSNINRFPVSSTPTAGTLTDRSGTIAAGATAQQAAAANAARIGWAVQNLHASADLWVSTLAAAVPSQPSIRLAAGALYESPPGAQGSGAISIVGAITGQPFSAREW